MIEVLNASRLPPPEQWPRNHAYVGRRSNRKRLDASPLRNQFEQGNAAELVQHYRVWLVATMQEGREALRGGDGSLRAVEVVQEVDRLAALWREHGSLGLVCWCAPEPWCHAAVIKEVLEGMNGPGRD